jgi:hypothetical protein
MFRRRSKSLLLSCSAAVAAYQPRFDSQFPERPSPMLRSVEQRGATPWRLECFELEANAKTDLDLPVASWFLLRGAPAQCTETTWPRPAEEPSTEKAVRV